MRINPETLEVEGLPSRTLTTEEFNALELPPCPVCGTTIHLDRVDVTTWADRPRRRWMAGQWECPKGCAP